MAGKLNPIGNIITVRQGDSFDIRVQIKPRQGEIDFRGSQMHMQVRTQDDQLKWDLLATPIDIKNGLFSLNITPELSSIDVGDYKTDIQITTPDGRVNTFFPADVNKIGTFRVTEQVTNE